MSPFQALRDLATEAAIISSSAATLGWDQETGMPAKASPWRSRQLGWLAGREHQLRTSQRWQAALDQAEPDNDRELASLREMRRNFERAACLPTAFVERETELTSQAKHAWAEARSKDDFAAFAPYLEQIVALLREKADLWGFEHEPYDALLEDYERGWTAEGIAGLFEALAPELRETAARAVERSVSRSPVLPAGPYPIEAQQAFNREVAASMGFDFDQGRIDTTTHPFCTTLGPADVRLTTRYDLDDFTSSLFGVMHEAGHGLYEQGLWAADFGLPAGGACSYGIHESQSRLWENHVGRSRAFWEKWLPVAGRHFPQLSGVSLDDFLAYVWKAGFTPIRVEADEATYDLHILLRFDLERRLLRGELAVADVPAAWNDAFEASFGSRPPSDREGCLQDIHWSMGGIGYFPTYTLGNLGAAQLFAAACRHPEIGSGVEKADYAGLLKWLRENVHDAGATLPPADLIRRATGEEPSAAAHLAHLRERYTA
ncbi:carboxypeptidase M32 [Haloferula sargassicola]|uniref:Metal-dependent carboxypeptidase n=1 Tax=Haloferula sargassicola TaxID=490096 RepID=A0ABP9UJ81_9BACT